MDDWHPLQVLSRVALIALIAIILGLILPGLVAHRNGAFYYGQIVNHLPEAGQKKVQAFEDEKRQKRLQISKLDEALSRIANSEQSTKDLPQLLNLRNRLASELDTTPRLSTIRPFYLSDSMYLWSAMYFSLGCLIWLVSPVRLKDLRFRQWRTILPCGIGAY